MEKEIEEEYKRLKKIRKQESKNPIMDRTNNKIFVNILIAIAIILYFVATYICYTKLDVAIFERVLQVATLVLLAITITLFEVAYKKDSGTLAIIGIEFLIVSCHALSIPYILQVYGWDLRWYVTISGYMFAIYFVFKSIVVYLLGRKEYVKSLSDIAEIVKEEEPAKKEATKKKVEDID